MHVGYDYKSVNMTVQCAYNNIILYDICAYIINNM